ncbi:MAG: glycosyltransferase [Terrimicrobiaceae bacterium]
MSDRNFVFLDPRGRRWNWIRLVAGLGLLLLLSLLIVFIRALWVKPELHMPDSLRAMKMELRTADSPATRTVALNRPWMKFAQTPHQRKRTGIAEPNQTRISAALLAAGDPRSLLCLSRHASELTHVCLEMLTVSGQPARLTSEIDPEVLSAARASRLQIFPILTNLVGQRWDTDAVEGLLLADESTQLAFASNVINSLENVGASGMLVDWQGIDPSLSAKLVEFLGRLHLKLRKENLELWLSIPVGDDLRTFDLEDLPGVVDHLVAQLHDENAEDDAPGPVASQPWFEGWLRTLMGYGEPGQWILSLGAYGYDWNTATKKTSTISFADAMARAQRSGEASVTSSAPDFNPTFSYDSEGESHAVWFLDASTFANQLRSLDQEGCAGVLINQLGTEDPGIWPILDHHSGDEPSPQLLQELETIEPKSVIAQIGEGDFLTADLTSESGSRQLWVDSDGYVCETYKKWPVYPTVVHFQDAKPNHVALTFDDGPDPKWTPQILDILRQYHVHATFFVIGKHAEDHPGLIRRILKEGHEIGSHTYTHPNLSEITPEQTTLELNATQRLIEWISGRTTILFRPPYNADSMPVSLAEARPIALATDLGYITVGESIDPEDWERPGTDEIVRRVKQGRDAGSIILLHDAGGNRSQTVAALPVILDFLKARGDTVVPAGKLLGLNRDYTMPPLAASAPSVPNVIANAGLLAVNWSEEFLWAFMIVTSLLTLLRSVALAFLSLSRKSPPSSGNFTPSLSVLVAAYNEEKVIASTLRSLLKTDYSGSLEIIVVDDGSSDETGARADEVGDPRIRVLRQANGGKSSALTRGLAVAGNEVIVFLDADTQFQPDTLRLLVQPLVDPRVGAVSGHARVGNLQTWIARFQSLEYICGFNLDRRAYDRVNAITVVPGAISAFRRAAIEQSGGLDSDTIAEDTDLTLSLHRMGWRVTYAPEAIAWTEAPDTIRALAKQRFRWAFGTMQCLWKHRDLILNPRFGALGCFSLPSIVLFQIVLVAAVPVVDVLLIISLLSGAGLPFIAYFLAFLICDLALATLACWIEKEPLRRAAWIIPMRFIYRPVLSYVVWRSLLHMLRGAWVGWGKLDRKGTVTMQPVKS